MGKKFNKLLVMGTAVAGVAVLAKKQKEQKAQGRPVKGIDVDEKIKQFKDKVEEFRIQAANATAEPRENMKITLKNMKGDAISHAEEFRRKAERSKSKISSELLKAQMNYEVKKEEFAKELDQKKYDNQKAKDEAKARAAAADAAILMEYALEMVEQATIAGLEATELVEEYKETYGEEIKIATEKEGKEKSEADADEAQVDADDFAD